MCFSVFSCCLYIITRNCYMQLLFSVFASFLYSCQIIWISFVQFLYLYSVPEIYFLNFSTHSHASMSDFYIQERSPTRDLTLQEYYGGISYNIIKTMHAGIFFPVYMVFFYFSVFFCILRFLVSPVTVLPFIIFHFLCDIAQH